MWCGCTYDSVRERWIESSIRIEHIIIIHIKGGTLGKMCDSLPTEFQPDPILNKKDLIEKGLGIFV